MNETNFSSTIQKKQGYFYIDRFYLDKTVLGDDKTKDTIPKM